MSKTKAASRLLSSLLAILMVFCLLPINQVTAMDVGPYFVMPRVDNGQFAGATEDIPDEVWNTIPASNQREPGGEYNPPQGDKPQVGETFVIPMPTSMEIVTTNYTYTFSGIHTRLWLTTDERVETRYNNITSAVSIEIPDNIRGVWIYYIWVKTETSDAPEEPDNPSSEERPYLTNFIFSVDRTVAQNNSALTPVRNTAGTDVYTVAEDASGMKTGLILSYDTSMDMRELGISGLDEEPAPGMAWATLLANAQYITDDTYVDLHFTFDSKIDMETLDTSKAYLQSDMFVLRTDVETYEKNGQELIVHCRWDSARANDKLTVNGSLDPMIYFNGLKVNLPADWQGEDSITIAGTGKVDGWMYADGERNGQTIDLDWEIDGGDETDEFILKVAEPVPEEPEEEEPEPEEPSIIIPDNGPSISIRKVWVEDTEEDRPDSIWVEIYHDEELYDTIEVEEKYRWRTSYNIPDRYKYDDWWIQEIVPEGYEDYIDETRDNVFVITNTYVGVEEPSEESSEPSVTPSEPSVEPSEPSSEPVSETEPVKPTLPQTGQLWWPVVVLLAGGAVLVAFGAFRNLRGNGRRER